MTTMTQLWGAAADVQNGALNNVITVNSNFDAIAKTFTAQGMSFSLMGQFGNQLRLPFFHEFPIQSVATATNIASRNGHYAGTAGTLTLQSYPLVLDTAGSAMIAGIDYAVFGIIDECTAGTVNTSVWTGHSTVTASSDGLVISDAGGGTLQSKDLSGETNIHFRYSISCGAVASAACQMDFVDNSTNTSNIASLSGTTGGGNSNSETQVGEVYLNINWASNIAKGMHMYEFTRSNISSGGASTAKRHRELVPISISTSGWNALRIKMVSSATSGVSGTIFYLRKVKSNPTNTVLVQASANGGNNFYKGLNGGFFDVSQKPGTALTVKATSTISGTTEVVVFSGITLAKA